MKKIWIVLLAAGLITSCGSETETTENTTDSTSVTAEEENTMGVDSVLAEEATEEHPDATIAVSEATTIEEFEKKSASSMSFCDCVKKQNELDEKMAEEEDDAKLEALLTEAEELRKGDCRVLTMGPQASPAQRAERERKVKACLE